MFTSPRRLSASILVSLSLGAHAATPQVAGLRELYDGIMLPGIEVTTFAYADTLQPVRIVHRGASSQPLPRRTQPFPKIHFEVGGRRSGGGL